MGFIVPGSRIKRRKNRQVTWHVDSGDIAIPLERRKVPRISLPKADDQKCGFEKLPDDAILEIMTRTGITDNFLNITNRHFSLLLSLSSRVRPDGTFSDSSFVAALLRRDFIHDLNSLVRVGWTEKLRRRLALLELEESSEPVSAAELPDILTRHRFAVDIRLFSLRWVSDEAAVHAIHGLFPHCLVLLAETIETEQNFRQRFVEWQLKKVSTMVTLRRNSQPQTYTTISALEEAARKTEEDPPSGPAGFGPLLTSANLPHHWLDNPSKNKFNKMVALNSCYGCAPHDFGHVLAQSLTLGVNLAANLWTDHVFSWAPSVPSLNTIVRYLHVLAKVRSVQVQYPVETRHVHPSSAAVDRLFRLVANAFSSYTFVNDDREALLWQLLGEIDMQELVLVALDHGATPNIDQFDV